MINNMSLCKKRNFSIRKLCDNKVVAEYKDELFTINIDRICVYTQGEGGKIDRYSRKHYQISHLYQ